MHLRARDYAPELGVFPSLDSIEGSLSNVMALNRYGYVAGNPILDAVGELLGLNRYAYVGGNPVNLVDPSGMTACRYPIDFCPITGEPVNTELPKEQQRCTFTYNKDLAMNWALDLGSSTMPHRQKVGSQVDFCSIFMSDAIVAGGMPVLDDPPVNYNPSDNLVKQLGLCPGQLDSAYECAGNWRNVDNFVQRYLKRGCSRTSLGCEPRIDHEGVFLPPVSIIGTSHLQKGDLIYQSSFDPAFHDQDPSVPGHISMFIGYGPNTTIDRLDPHWNPGQFPQGLSDTHSPQTSPYRWVIDDQSWDTPKPRVFIESITEVIRIPSQFTIRLDYLRASV